MIRLLTTFTLFAGALLSSDLAAHGGVYIGPGDVVPPGAGSPPESPTTPTPPTTPPTPGAPPSPVGPTSPDTPITPIPPGVPPLPLSKAITAPGGSSVDLTRWEFWWEFNKSHFLNLKAKVHSAESSTGEADILEGIDAGASTPMTSAPTHGQITSLIAPRLRLMLETSDDRDIAGSSMMALAKIRLDASAIDLFKTHLGSNDQEISETAALAYGVIQSPTAYPVLEALALDTAEGRRLTHKPTGVPARTRAFAIYGMGLLGSHCNDSVLQNKIADQLWQLLITDDSSYKDLKTACVISLGVIPYQDPSSVVERLLNYLNDGNNETLVRAHCPNAIAKILNQAAETDPSNPLIPQAVDTFSRYCKARNVKNEIVQSCVYSLGMLTNPSVEFPLDQAFEAISHVIENGKNKQAERFGVISMAHLGAQSGQGPHREKAIKFLSSTMRKGKGGMDAWSGLALGVMAFYVREQGSAMPSTVEHGVLDKFLNESNQQRKGAYAISLGLMKAEIASEHLRLAIDHCHDDAFQGYACLGLGLIGAREYKDFLTDIVISSTRKPDLLKQASIALGLLKDKGASTQLLKLIRPESQKTPSLAVLSAAATAIGFIGDKDSVSPLIETMTDRKMTPLARAFAAVALGAISDSYELPWNSMYSRDLNYRASVQTLTNQATGVLDIL
jgi:HEAT repeat protein